MFKLSKKLLNKEIVPLLSIGKRGPKCKCGLWRIMRAILRKLKSGCQWRELPVRELFGRFKTTWGTVYYWFNKWSRDGSFAKAWARILALHRAMLDMSSVQLDGSHTAAKSGGQQVGYQGRKKCRATNMVFLTDKRGIPLACGAPMAGNHHDLYGIEKSMQEIVATCNAAGLSVDGLFMNADAGFDARALVEMCFGLGIIANIDRNPKNADSLYEGHYVFDEQLYKERFVVERTNAWLDSYKTLLVRFEKKTDTWLAFHYCAFMMILLKKAYRDQKL